MKDQAIISPPKLSNPVEMFAIENYLGELQDTELKEQIIVFIKEFKELKDTNFIEVFHQVIPKKIKTQNLEK